MKFQTLRLGKCNRPVFSLGHKLYHWHSTNHGFSFSVSISIYERLENLWEALKFVLVWMHFTSPFCWADISPAGLWTCPRLRNLLRGISNTDKFERPKITSKIRDCPKNKRNESDSSSFMQSYSKENGKYAIDLEPRSKPRSANLSSVMLKILPTWVIY